MKVRRGPLLPVFVALGLLLTAGSAAAAASFVLHGKGLVPGKATAPGELGELLFFPIPELESEFISLV